MLVCFKVLESGTWGSEFLHLTGKKQEMRSANLCSGRTPFLKSFTIKGDVDRVGAFSEYSQKKKSLQEAIEKSKMGRQDTAERAALIKELTALRQKRDQLKAEIDKYKECDPDIVEEIRQANKVAKEAANRWTDNIFAAKSWAKRKFAFEESKIDKTFGIPEDFDYIN
nr:meiotic nuclear division protein 1 homolog isoform X2 [Zootoca vivipara]